MRKSIFTSLAFIALVALSLGNSMQSAKASGSARIFAAASTTKADAGDPITITIKVDGGGKNFTTFGANVSLTNLTATSLTKGSQVAQWITQPSTGQLNFIGGVTGEVGSVTVYTLKVKGKKAGAASVAISGGTVTSTDGFTVQEILGSQSGVNLTITEAPAVTPTPQPETPAAPVLTSPTLPDNQTDLETEWQKLTVNNNFDLTLGLNPATLKADTSANTLTGLRINGIADANSLVTLFIFSQKLAKTVTSDANGRFEIILDSALEAGNHTIYSTITKESGTTRASDPITFKLDPSKTSAKDMLVSKVLEKEITLQPITKQKPAETSSWLFWAITLGTEKTNVGAITIGVLILLSIVITYLSAKPRRSFWR